MLVKLLPYLFEILLFIGSGGVLYARYLKNTALRWLVGGIGFLSFFMLVYQLGDFLPEVSDAETGDTDLAQPLDLPREIPTYAPRSIPVPSTTDTLDVAPDHSIDSQAGVVVGQGISTVSLLHDGQPFRIAIYETTNEQFVEFLNAGIGSHDVERLIDLPHPTSKIYLSESGYLVRKNYSHYPVVGVTWYGARRFAEWVGGRLASVDEWEFAAKGNSNHSFSGSDVATQVAWFDKESVEEVGSKRPNQFGLYDMSGNASEWCLQPESDDKAALKGGGLEWTYSLIEGDPVHTRYVHKSLSTPDSGIRVVF